MIQIKKENLSCYEALPKEPQSSFNKFIIYRDLKPHTRSVRRVCEIICDYDKTGIFDNKLYKSLQRLCTKWHWIERVKLYDADQQLKLAKKREDNFDEMSNVLLDNVEGLIKYANNLLGQIIKNPKKDNGDEYSLMTKIKMTKDVSALLKEAHELLCNLCGRPSSYSSYEFDGLIDVTASVVDEETEEEKLERYADYFKQINSKATSISDEDSAG